MTLDELLDDCKRVIGNKLAITDVINFRQISHYNLKVFDLRKVKQLGKSFKNAKCAKSYTIETIKAYMLEGGSTLEGHTGLVRAVIQLKDDRLVSVSNDNTLKVWGVPINKNTFLINQSVS